MFHGNRALIVPLPVREKKGAWKKVGVGIRTPQAPSLLHCYTDELRIEKVKGNLFHIRLIHFQRNSFDLQFTYVNIKNGTKINIK